MTQNVAVVGVGQTRYGNRHDVNYVELMREAVTACLADAGVEIDEIDAVVSGSMPALMEGIEAPELWLSEGLGAVNKPMMRVATCGSTGMSIAHSAYYHVASGVHDLVLAVGFEKMYQSDPQGAMSTVGDPIFMRAFLAGAPGIIALQCREYMARCAVPAERIRAAAARVSVRNHVAALKNPYAHIKQDITVEDVLRSRVVCEPLRLLDICPSSDGACAVLFASEKRAKRFSGDLAWVKGLAYAGDEYWIADKDLARWQSAIVAAETAYEMAGISDPLEELDVAEVYNPFTFQEMIFYECFRFCPEGMAYQFVEDGVFDPEGKLPCDPSGGVLCSNAIGATALVRVGEAALQVMGKAGERQVRGAKTALSHGWGGAIQFNGVMILSNTL
jgi:acetyl-CoA C-acetyltransferase